MLRRCRAERTLFVGDSYAAGMSRTPFPPEAGTCMLVAFVCINQISVRLDQHCGEMVEI
jgi:hypothetical protein